jgi:transcriptional regulator with PAS, ATPase and Fis domain
LPVNITGATGTGKELFAQNIHSHSARSHCLFITIICAAITENLLESELFDYADGAFTNPRKGGKPGIFEIARRHGVY